MFKKLKTYRLLLKEIKALEHKKIKLETETKKQQAKLDGLLAELRGEYHWISQDAAQLERDQEKLNLDKEELFRLMAAYTFAVSPTK